MYQQKMTEMSQRKKTQQGKWQYQEKTNTTAQKNERASSEKKTAAHTKSCLKIWFVGFMIKTQTFFLSFLALHVIFFRAKWCVLEIIHKYIYKAKP